MPENLKGPKVGFAARLRKICREKICLTPGSGGSHKDHRKSKE